MRWPPSYRQRLRVEGGTLAASGLIGSGVLLVATRQTTRGPLSTVGQLVIVALALAVFGVRGLRRSIAAAEPIPAAGAAGSGEPTPLWQLPLITVGLTLPVGFGVGWDAGLRVTAGCALVGAFQAIVLARLVARDERSRGRTYYRRKGSRILRGTRLGFSGAAVSA